MLQVKEQKVLQTLSENWMDKSRQLSWVSHIDISPGLFFPSLSAMLAFHPSAVPICPPPQSASPHHHSLLSFPPSEANLICPWASVGREVISTAAMTTVEPDKRLSSCILMALTWHPALLNHQVQPSSPLIWSLSRWAVWFCCTFSHQVSEDKFRSVQDKAGKAFFPRCKWHTGISRWRNGTRF